MILKFNSSRDGSGTEYSGQMQKISSDKVIVAINYGKMLEGSDYIDSCTITAADLEGNDVTSTMIEEFVTGNKVEGTATGGSLTTLEDTATDFSAKGVTPGDHVLNSTQNFRFRVSRLYTGSNAFDTLEFKSDGVAVSASDAYKFLFSPTYVKAGTPGGAYIVTFTCTTALGVFLTDKILVKVI